MEGKKRQEQQAFKEFRSYNLYESHYCTPAQAHEKGGVENDIGYDSVRERNIPLGRLAIYCGMQVEATNGKVGKLNELLLDPQSGEITHLLMREGHLWGKKEVSVPVSAIDFCDS